MVEKVLRNGRKSVDGGQATATDALASVFVSGLSRRQPVARPATSTPLRLRSGCLPVRHPCPPRAPTTIISPAVESAQEAVRSASAAAEALLEATRLVAAN